MSLFSITYKVRCYDCSDVSEAETSREEARHTAQLAGWMVGRMRAQCPHCQVLMREAMEAKMAEILEARKGDK